jgi:signal transduction histidine kinase/CheY-like chemotaxis protein
MFFLDRTGFFSLVSLFIQCLMAWVSVGFFVGMQRTATPWVRRWMAAFVCLGLGLSAVSVRFLLAHQHMGNVERVGEQTFLTKAFYAVYLAGKCGFYWFLVTGVVSLRQGRWVPKAPSWAALPIGLGALLGVALPTIEAMLLAQLPLLATGFVYAVQLLRTRPGEPRSGGRQIVAAVLAIWAAVWLVYAICAVAVGLFEPVTGTAWSIPLRLNSVVDLVLQVVLATGLVMVVLQEAWRTANEAQGERDRLREQVQKDEQMRAFSGLVSTVAHEINNPLTAILGYAEDLGDPDPKLRAAAAKVVQEQAERCRGIVHRLSLLGRRVPPPRQVTPVGDLVARVVRGFQPQFARTGVHLVTTGPETPVWFEVDPTGVEQMLTNLLANALQVSSTGHTVRLLVTAASGMVQFEVVDQGPGVPPRHRQRIFEPFWTTKGDGQGTGIGLAVARSLVTAHGGSIEVGDAPGGGAVFRVRLPTCATPTPTPWLDARGPQAASPSSRPSSAAPRRLLVVDDEAVVRATLVRQATQAGWQCREAESGEAALALLAGRAPGADFDVVVCDLRMPGLGGIGLHDRLQQSAPLWLQCMVFVTGDLGSPEAAEFAGRCRAPILTKPFGFGELQQRLLALPVPVVG